MQLVTLFKIYFGGEFSEQSIKSNFGYPQVSLA